MRRRFWWLAATLPLAPLLAGCALLFSPSSAPPLVPPSPVVVGSSICVVDVYRVEPTGERLLTGEAVAQTRDIIEARLRAAGLTHLKVAVEAPDRIVVAVPAGADPDAIRRLVGTVGQLDFVGVPEAFASQVVDGQPLPPGLDATPIFSGDQIASANPATDASGQLALSIELKDTGSRLLDAYASAHPGERFAIILDGIVLTAPTINASRFEGKAQISGSFTAASLADLVALLRFGALPLRVVAEGSDTGPCPSAAP